MGFGATSSATVDDCLDAIGRVVRSDWEIVEVSTITGKESLLDAVADRLGAARSTWPAERLDRVDVPEPSTFARESTGSASVAEASALLAAVGGHLLIGKVRDGAVTVAVATFVPNTGAEAAGGAL